MTIQCYGDIYIQGMNGKRIFYFSLHSDFPSLGIRYCLIVSIYRYIQFISSTYQITLLKLQRENEKRQFSVHNKYIDIYRTPLFGQWPHNFFGSFHLFFFSFFMNKNWKYSQVLLCCSTRMKDKFSFINRNKSEHQTLPSGCEVYFFFSSSFDWDRIWMGLFWSNLLSSQPCSCIIWKIIELRHDFDEISVIFLPILHSDYARKSNWQI